MNKSSRGVILTPGTVLGGTYQIIRQIGQGGMGAVYMAYDTRLDLKVAIKVIAPEQFYNFSLARAPADIFSIGSILYEVVEGRISDKLKPFKQVWLSNTESDYLKRLNEIVMTATAEKPNERIGSVRELKERLLQLEYCRLDGSPALPERKGRRL